MESLIKKLCRGQDTLMYTNRGTSVHDDCTTPIKGWLGTMSFELPHNRQGRLFLKERRELLVQERVLGDCQGLEEDASYLDSGMIGTIAEDHKDGKETPFVVVPSQASSC